MSENYLLLQLLLLLLPLLFIYYFIIYYSVVVVIIYLSDEVGPTAYFPASLTGSTALPPAIDSPTWAPVGTPGAPQYVTTDLFAAATGPGPSVIVAGDSPSSQHHQPPQQQPQQVPAQPLHLFQPYPQHVSVVPAPPPTTPHQPHHPATYLQQPAPAPAHLQVCNILFYSFIITPKRQHININNRKNKNIL